MTDRRQANVIIFATTILLFLGTGCQSVKSATQPGYPAAHSLPQTAYPAPAGLPAATVIQRTLVFPAPPDTASEPQDGKASLSGLLFSVTTLSPIADTMFYLTPAVGEQHDHMPPLLSGPDALRGDLTGRSLEDGSFDLNAVSPGNYFLIVSAPGNWCEAIASEDNPSPRLITLAAGQRLVLKVLAIRWP
jgi:hypothetical protein